MILINTTPHPTPLSSDKIASLLSALGNQKCANPDEALPDEVEACVADFVDANLSFVKSIDE